MVVWGRRKKQILCFDCREKGMDMNCCIRLVLSVQAGFLQQAGSRLRDCGWRACCFGPTLVQCTGQPAAHSYTLLRFCCLREKERTVYATQKYIFINWLQSLSFLFSQTLGDVVYALWWGSSFICSLVSKYNLTLVVLLPFRKHTHKCIIMMRRLKVWFKNCLHSICSLQRVKSPA